MGQGWAMARGYSTLFLMGVAVFCLRRGVGSLARIRKQPVKFE